MGTHPIFESDFDCLTEWDEAHPVLGPDRGERTRDREADPAGDIPDPEVDPAPALFWDITMDMTPRSRGIE